ncbi:MAG: ferredoxin [Candidatus Sungbacteria bacterium]|nr:ferredoxin [Candidatus Sungbacteria bacterium]
MEEQNTNQQANNTGAPEQKVAPANNVPAGQGSAIKKIGKIVVDRDLCIGAASCIAVAPGVFELDGENKAVVYNDKGADDETILLAAKSCPTQAILLFDEEGNQIFP